MRVGTRGSQLALWQAHAVARLVQDAGGPACEIVIIRTSGDEAGTGLGPGGETLPSMDQERPDVTPPPPTADRRTSPPVTSVKSLFVKELEEALLDGRIDMAVHSSKDMPAALPAGLVIGATLPREDPRDAVILPTGRPAPADVAALVSMLGAAPRIGTSSVRRVAQLGRFLTNATFASIRGNLDTRLRKLDGGEFDAIVLASAGLRRLGHQHRIALAVPTDVCTPSPGQGIIAVEHVAGRVDVAAALAPIRDADAADALTAERAVVLTLGGGCQMPIGAIARVAGSTISIDAVVIAPDGSRALRRTVAGPRASAAVLGESLARSLLEAGAAGILDAARRAQ